MRAPVSGKDSATIRCGPSDSASSWMTAIQMHEYGGPEVLRQETVPRPQVKADELLLKVHAAGVNPADWQIRSGKRFRLQEPFSLTLGFDVSGVVETVGEDCHTFRVGDEVFGMADIRRGGAYAQYVAVPATHIARKPASLSHTEAAALPVAALTAWQALFDTAQLRVGQRVLIHAAAGGVGHLAVQLAKHKEAYVIGTASAQNEGFLRRIGVDHFIDYSMDRWQRDIRDVDVVLESVNRDARLEDPPGRTLSRSWQMLKRNGILVSICTTPSRVKAACYGVRACYVRTRPEGKQLARIATLADKGYIRPYVSHSFPLTQAPLAHKISQGGHTRGKIVLQVSEDFDE